MDLFAVVTTIAGAMISFILGYFVKKYRDEARMKEAQKSATRVLAEAQTKAKEMVLEAKDEALRIRDAAEAEHKQKRNDLQRQEQHLRRRRASIERRVESLDDRVRKLEGRERQVEQRNKELERLKQRQVLELERISGLSRGEAKELFLKKVAEEARQDAARVIREIEVEVMEEGHRKARKIIANAIQRLASDQVTETTVSTVPLPSDEMKGRIIGRAGRNIRAIEKATGVDLVVDDTPEAVILSCYDPVRREVAHLALTRLIADGRIHPGRIEKIVAEAKEEVETTIREEGERVVYNLGLPGMNPELIKILGQLKFRTSYGQNVLAHSVETAHLAAMMAYELNADVQLAKEGALLHDIGKAVSHEVEGSHAIIGADMARRLGKSPQIVNCISAHHDEDEPQSVEAILVAAADAISGARPGARRETLESYIKRIKALENVANSFKGVSQSYAIQAGREIRIIVKPDEVDDLGAINLSKDIAKQIEESLEYPGQIKVTVIRETRAVDYAK
ncbi:MAG: ribonuclease Y [Anaerolineae bacterium]